MVWSFLEGVGDSFFFGGAGSRLLRLALSLCFADGLASPDAIALLTLSLCFAWRYRFASPGAIALLTSSLRFAWRYRFADELASLRLTQYRGDSAVARSLPLRSSSLTGLRPYGKSQI